MEIIRLWSTATCDDVNRTVKPCDEDEGPSVFVPGKLHGPIHFSRIRGTIKLVLSAGNEAVRDAWMSEFRIRIAPWKLLC